MDGRMENLALPEYICTLPICIAVVHDDGVCVQSHNGQVMTVLPPPPPAHTICLSSVRLRRPLPGRPGANGAASGPQRWKPGVRRAPPPARLPQWDAGRRHGALQRDGVHHAQDLAQGWQHQPELQHVQEGRVLMGITRERQVLPLGLVSTNPLEGCNQNNLEIFFFCFCFFADSAFLHRSHSVSRWEPFKIQQECIALFNQLLWLLLFLFSVIMQSIFSTQSKKKKEKKGRENLAFGLRQAYLIS